MRRWHLGALAGIAAGLGAYALLVEPRWLERREPRIHLRHLPRDLEGFRIGLLTDLHAGRVTTLDLIQRAAHLVMEREPHLIALTGDFASDRAAGFDEILEALSELRAPLGVFAVPGNHDHIVGIEKWHAAIAHHGYVEDLTNRSVMRQVGGARVCVAGVDDYYEGHPDVRLPPPEERDFTLLLAHSPDQAERCRRACDAVDLIVSGHTHGGQVRVPGVGAVVNSAQYEIYDEGVRRRPWTQVYTSRGLGTVHLPVRFLARPEVTVLHLTSAPRPPR